MKRTRIASHRRLKKILVDAGLDQATAAADVDALHAGHVLVLVQSDSALDDIAAVIDDLDQGTTPADAPRCCLIEPTESKSPPLLDHWIAEEAPSGMLAALTGLLAPYREALVIAALANPRP